MLGNEVYPYLKDNSRKLLEKNRNIFKKNKMDEKIVINSVDDKIIFPFLGTKALTTLSYIIQNEGYNNEILKCNGIPLGIKVNGLITEKNVKDIVNKIINDKIKIEDIKLDDIEINKKYSEYIPECLKEKEFRYDILSINKLKEELNYTLKK